MEESGYKVKLTRDGDYLPDWADRVDSAVDDLFIAIHCNGASNPSAEGIETYYYQDSEEGKLLAQAVHKNLIKLTKRADRSIKANDDFYVLEETKCPAILVEIAFITIPEEEKLLNSVDYRLQVAVAVIKGIKEVEDN